jgi:hypothetical protein
MEKLTHRQQEFLSRFLDLYREERDNLHYTVVARRLGVGNVTAYEMLRLLEQRGLVEATYQLPEEPRGPGRATVLFRPTPLAARLLDQLAGGNADAEEWETVKARILRQLEAGKPRGYETLLAELLARAPDQCSELTYAAEMIATIILTLCSLQERIKTQGLLRRLRALLGAGDLELSVLAGLSMGLSIVEGVNRQVADLLLTQSERLQSTVLALSAENRRRLASCTREALRIVEW